MLPGTPTPGPGGRVQLVLRPEGSAPPPLPAGTQSLGASITVRLAEQPGCSRFRRAQEGTEGSWGPGLARVPQPGHGALPNTRSPPSGVAQPCPASPLCSPSWMEAPQWQASGASPASLLSISSWQHLLSPHRGAGAPGAVVCMALPSTRLPRGVPMWPQLLLCRVCLALSRGTWHTCPHRSRHRSLCLSVHPPASV